MSRKRKRRKSRKKLAYGVIAAAFILACFLTYFSLHQSNQTPPDQTSQPKAAIVDHLSFRNETKNETFKLSSKDILKTVGFNVDYYPGETVTVDFYKHLAWQDYGLIVLRVHSAIIGNGTELAFFTSEHYDPDNIPPAYYEDLQNKRLVEAYFTEEEREQGERYFAIAPRFVEKYGTFQNTVIIMMGCDGLKYNTTAEAFRREGAEVCIGWDGLVSTPHTDHATTCLLQHLAQGYAIEKAVEETMNEVGPEKTYNSTTILKYYPDVAGSYIIQYTLGISNLYTVRANVVLVKEEKKGTRSNWL